MPYVEGRHGGRAALVEVAIIDAARHREHKASRRPVLAGVRPYAALIDTGASSTMITSRVVHELGLLPVGSIPYHGLDGPSFKRAYLFHVAFYDSDGIANFEVDDGDQHVVEAATPVNRIHVCTHVITGGELDTLPSFDVLLGMDIITTGQLVVRSDGSFIFSF
jgi:hypothetical protein